MLDLTAALQREPRPLAENMAKLEQHIDRALRRTSGDHTLAFKNLVALAQAESELGDLISDVCAVSFAAHFFRTCEYLDRN